MPRKERITENTYQMSRWTPMVKDVVEDLIESKLEEKHFPFLGGRNAGMGQAAPSRWVRRELREAFLSARICEAE